MYEVLFQPKCRMRRFQPLSSFNLMQEIFDHSLNFDPAEDFAAFLRKAPAKWVVYLLADAEDRPVQLLCVKNLRYSLERRMGVEAQASGPSRRVNYREIVRRIYWRRVDSRFEADWIYLEASRRLFPETYQSIVGFRPAWFIHINPETDFPRYSKTTELSLRSGAYLGPLESKSDAAKLIEQIEDWFDLCRYYHILVEAPHGKACAYKDMGKCPAPCDGSISLDQYRALIRWSLQTLMDPAPMIHDQQQRMNAAAGELRFEVAGRIKQFIDSISQLGRGPYRHLRTLDQFAYLSIQRGPKERLAKVFLVTPGTIQEIAGLIAEPDNIADVIRMAQDALRASSGIDAERIGVVTHHLFAPKQTDGVYLHLPTLQPQDVAVAWRQLLKQKPVEEPLGEGVMKETTAQ